MNLEMITFTGVDESVNPEDLVRFAEQFPSVKIEWGVLLSEVKQGKIPRYPGKEWRDEFLSYHNVNRAGHIEGSWLMSLVTGDYFKKVPYLGYDRIQLNFGKKKYESITLPPDCKYIIPITGINDHLYHDSHHPLFDLSMGKGVRTEWPKPLHPELNGYAGGISPETIKEDMKRLEDKGKVWIDMETGVRDGDKFSLDKCEKVLEMVV